MKAAVVCNAGPLIALALIDRLTLLPLFYSRILVPERVYLEVLAGGRNGAGVDAIRAASFLEVVTPALSMDPLLQAMLDPGEASVINLARTEKVQDVLLDDRKGRRVARQIYGLSVIGTARLLIRAKFAGAIPSVGRELHALQLHGYWLGDNVVREACRLAGE
jgi:predicted nucleic acid-binding protein